MIRLAKDIFARRDLLSMLVVRNVKIRYKESALGFLWTLLGPIFLIAIYAFFMKLIMKFPMPMTCLLYTSPSPRDRTRSRMPSSA